MRPFFKKINAYIRVKLFDKIDSRVWRFSEDNSGHYVYREIDKDLISKYYPHIDVGHLKEDDPETILLMEQFMSYIYKFERRC
jgi:hypothetical protein